MPQCYVENCGNYYGKTRGNAKIIYHMMPLDPALAAKWAKLCGRPEVKRSSYARVCSDHFSPKCYQRDLQHELLGLPLRRKLKPDAVPDTNLPKPYRPRTKDTKILPQPTNIIKTMPKLCNTFPKKPIKEDIEVPKIEAKLRKILTTSSPVRQRISIMTRSPMSFNHSQFLNSTPTELYVSKLDSLKENESKNNNNSSKNNNKCAKLPMRSSYRIAKKKSIESLSDSFTEKVNSKARSGDKPERFEDKLKFMAKLQLKFERKENSVQPANNSENFLGTDKNSLNKMQIMENVREGCTNNPPSSPGHAEQRQEADLLEENEDETQVKKEDPVENGVEPKADEDVSDSNDLVIKEEIKKIDEDSEKIEENNGNHSPTNENHKRSLESDETPIKRLKLDIQENFNSREKIINEFIEIAECNNLDQIQCFSEQILSEIRTLNEMAKEKEREWNHIIHMKKIKEELLIRIQRKKQVILINDSDLSDFQPEINGQLSLLKCNQKSSILRNANMDRSKQKNFMQNKAQMDINTLDLRQKQRPTLDVQSIIADHRQRHPEVIPRRGGSFSVGQKSEQDSNSELGFLLSHMNGNLENSRSSNLESYVQDNTSYKDILLQFAKLSQKERNELQMHLQNNTKPPPPYPEVTVHPVTSTSSVTPTNSLLHGILTKTTSKPTGNSGNPPNPNSKSTFSPTLARLLTAPERGAANQLTSTPLISGNLLNPSTNMSISEIFSGSKARNEITITPVGSSQYDSGSKGDSLDDEGEEHPDRLIIDETSENLSSRVKDDNSSENGDDIPQCQGCNQKPAQFVCAGCGNQWYCSRDCQVAAWDEHSEVCSG
ncbi:putative leucine-rich repeat-containing protein DDB_G0290503 isoform X2 [Sitophilus oryzae]|uniref:Leucine-rich repeat-containing protein DDB_G0290503 isoform X2 n=1 Tax=Sitophilus oryzae TaxID=7048 RepID=A0A6J2XQF4_SITOR|nr:putative leucine-rich repeat-containing protein DDB_G0290503 isoform X2 [Sitophilus oryzae]